METSPGKRYVLPERVTPLADGLDDPFWQGAQSERLELQRCSSCHEWQWGPEYICYHCGSFDLGWDEVPKTNDHYGGVIYSWERVWHPSSASLAEAIPYVTVLVELPTAGDCRLLGNVVGDPLLPVDIGDRVQAVFEHHPDFSLVQWKRVP